MKFLPVAVVLVIVALAVGRRPAAAPAPARAAIVSIPTAVPLATTVVESKPAAPRAVPAVVAKEDPLKDIFDRLTQALREGDAATLRTLAAEIRRRLAPGAIPDDINGASTLMKAFEAIATDTDEEKEAIEAIRNGTALPAQIQLAKEWLGRNRAALDLLTKGLAFEKVRFPIKYEDGFLAELRHVPWMLKASRLLDAAGGVARAEGGDGAAELALHSRLADSMRDEPILVSNLVRMVLVGRGASVDPVELRRSVRSSMLMEVAAAIDWGLQEVPEASLALPAYKAMGEHYFDSIREAMTLFERPYYESRAGFQSLEARIEAAGNEGLATREFAAAYGRVAQNLASAEARLGSEVDPFTGLPMRMSAAGKRYSVGPDLVDNGGDPEKDVVANR